MTDPIQQMASSDFNMHRLNTKQLEHHLSCSIAAGSNIVVIGRRGVGKSQICKQQIQNSGLHELYVNLSTFERTDLAGFPKVLSFNEDKDSVKREFVDYFLPRIYEPLMYGDKKVVILFDEVDKADSSLWAPLLEIVQFHSINGRSFPNLQSCIMTGNLISEGSNKICSPLLDRAEKYLLEASAAMWLEWAGVSGEIHPSIFEFINDNPNRLCGSVDNAENYADESPRGWHLSSKIMKFGEGQGWDKDIILEKIAGFVGKKSGIEYMSYYDHYQVLLPFIESVFQGNDRKIMSKYEALEPAEKLTACNIIMSRFANILDAHNPNLSIKSEELIKAIKNIGQFLKHAGYENIIASIRNHLTIQRITKWRLDDNTDWKWLITMEDEMLGKTK